MKIRNDKNNRIVGVGQTRFRGPKGDPMVGRGRRPALSHLSRDRVRTEEP